VINEPAPFSDYVVYLDESGDHNLTNDDPNYPMFVLAFCIFKKSDYTADVSPSIQRFKFQHFGHDAVVLHEHEIRKQQQPFVFLKNVEKRKGFMEGLNRLITDAPMTIIATAIHKTCLRERYTNPANPYLLALQFCLERTHAFLVKRGQADSVTHVIVECRGKVEDRDLELEFRRIRDGANYGRNRLDTIDLVFADKKANSGGLQLADLIARPIGIRQLRPNQENRAYDLIGTKFDTNDAGHIQGFGLKCFP
jgi:hypothetical protein